MKQRKRTRKILVKNLTDFVNIERIKNPHKENAHDPDEVWANVGMDGLRSQQCLCFNCDRKNEVPPYASCHIAKVLYYVSVGHDMAMAITRCGARDKKGEQMYIPLRLK